MHELGLQVLLDDDCLLAINKPSGLPTQAPRPYDSVERRVRDWLQQIHGDAAYLGLPHRLDRPATGVLLLAKTPRAARIVSRQFERRRVQKKYLALVSGQVTPACDVWQDYVRKLPGIPKVEIVSPDDPDALLAILTYQASHYADAVTRLSIELQTGRTHQIRVQSASRRHPILGDTLYGSQVPFGPATDDERQRAIALHAESLTIRHPTTGEVCTIAVEAPWPDKPD
jgi:RluA family pseudouridine synthase